MGLHKILSLLESEDVDVRVHAVKVVANLAAEGELYKTLIFQNSFFEFYLFIHIICQKTFHLDSTFMFVFTCILQYG